jgi:hypothetical protein
MTWAAAREAVVSPLRRGALIVGAAPTAMRPRVWANNGAGEQVIQWHRDPLGDGYILAATVWILAIATGVVSAGIDAANFYSHLDDPYGVHDYAAGTGFYYAPPVALVLRLLLPFGVHVFAALMSGIGLAALGWIGGRWAWALLFFPPVWWDISAGNVNTLIGAAAVAFLARPAWMGVLALTKITPGIVGLWWVIRGEWRALREAALVTGAICLVSLIIVPGWWIAWVSGLLSNGTSYVPAIFAVPVPLLPRLVVAALLVMTGARRGWRWMLPLAACAALPVLWWSGLAVLVGMLASDRHAGATRLEIAETGLSAGWIRKRL